MDNSTYEIVKKARKEKNHRLLKKIAYETNDYNIKSYYAILCFDLGKYTAAKTMFTKLLRTKKKEVALLYLGKISIIEKDYETARRYFNSVINTYIASNAFYELGKLELILNNDDKAKEFFIESLKIKKDVYVFYDLGKLEFKNENFKNAEECFSKALEIKPYDYYSKFELARTKCILKKENEAIKLLKELLEEYKNRKDLSSSYLYSELSKNYIKIKDYDNARKALDDGISLYEDDFFINFNYGCLEFYCKNFEKAKKYFEKILSKKEDANSRYLLGATLRMLGDFDEARKHLIKCINSDIKDKYNVLSELGKLEFRCGNLAKAIKYFEESIEKGNSNVEILSFLTLCYIKNNQLEKAATFIEKNPILKYALDRNVLLYLSKKLNIFYKDLDCTTVKLTYGEEQILDYDEKRAFNYITENIVKNYHSDEAFSKMDMYALFINLGNLLSEKNKINKFSMQDIYVVDLDGILIKVITIPNTKDIITFYPIYDKTSLYSDNSKEIINYSKKM